VNKLGPIEEIYARERAIERIQKISASLDGMSRMTPLEFISAMTGVCKCLNADLGVPFGQQDYINTIAIMAEFHSMIVSFSLMMNSAIILKADSPVYREAGWYINEGAENIADAMGVSAKAMIGIIRAQAMTNPVASSLREVNNSAGAIVGEKPHTQGHCSEFRPKHDSGRKPRQED
jgi:hypothetical protein